MNRDRFPSVTTPHGDSATSIAGYARPSPVGASAQAWRTVQAFVRARSGVVLTDDQSYLLEARLAPLVTAYRFSCLPDLVTAACHGDAGGLGALLIDAMTTHETFFFRDLPAWQTFEAVVVPTLLAARRSGLRIWSAACSDGQEPYSIAMLLEERWPALAAASTILATDVSAPAIERASAGVYSVLNVNRGLGAARLLRHFERASTGGFRVRRSLRERVTWQVASLLDGGPRGTTFDVVFCRNVLIYFEDGDRLSVLRSLSAETKPDGFVALGVSEVVSAKSIGPGWYQSGSLRAP